MFNSYVTNYQRVTSWWHRLRLPTKGGLSGEAWWESWCSLAEHRHGQTTGQSERAHYEGMVNSQK